MQFISTLVAGAAVASAAAIPVGSRDTQQNLDISEFSFSGTPHSVISQYQLNVSKSDGSMDAPVQCSTTTNTSPQVAPFDLTPCQDPSWSFAWTALNTSEGSGYNLKVTRLPQDGAAANETGCLFMPDSDVYYWQNPGGPTGDVYRVNQSSTFTMQWSNMDECVYH